ncbi:MAG: RluA family pseudouridine synthase [Bacilli bacterium]|nr:RluA family pseudouridine synthase [Bacilli bacterium]
MKLIVKDKSLLLEYLENNLDMSRKNLKNYLKNGSIYVDGVRTTKFDYPLNKNSIIQINTNSKNSKQLPFDILYEDENIIVVDKPSGILSIATNKEKELTVYHLLREYLKSKNKNAKVFVIHRLDKDTSGVLMFAKNEYSKNLFQKDWDKLVSERSYIAIVHGIMIEKEKTLVNYLKETTTNLVYISRNNDGKKAITSYKVLKEKNDLSKLRIYIQTGRKNQIRVQLSHIEHPILGDKKYGADSEKRLFLHADRLTVYNPILKTKMSFVSKVPYIFDTKLK